MTPTEIYIPKGCFALDKCTTDLQIRLALQGFGGTGKTYSALTFPNPIVANADRGLSAHQGRADVVEAPLWNDAYCRSINPNHRPAALKDTIMMWLEKEATKLTAQQTLVFDGNTGLQNAYHRWFAVNAQNYLTNAGKLDGFAEWTVKKTYFGEVMELFKTLQCHVVYICHEVDQKDKNGPQGPSYSGKVRPLLTGGFGDEILTHFTDWFRQLSADKLAPDAMTPDVLKMWGMTKDEFIAMQNSFVGNTRYYWQTESDSIFDAKRGSLINCPRFIPATYTAFKKYQRK